MLYITQQRTVPSYFLFRPQNNHHYRPHLIVRKGLSLVVSIHLHLLKTLNLLTSIFACVWVLTVANGRLKIEVIGNSLELARM